MIHPALNSASSDSRRPGLGVLLAAFLAYFAAIRLGIVLATGPEKLSLFWPAAGCGVWLVTRYGHRLLVPVILGELSRLFFTGATLAPLVGVSLGLGNTLAVFVGAWVYTRIASGSGKRGADFGEPIAWSVAALVMPLVSATIGVVGLKAGRPLVQGMWLSWSSWWTGDMLGTLLVAPLLTVLADTWRRVGQVTRHEWARGGFLFAVTALFAGLALGQNNGGLFLPALFPALLVATVWFGSLGARLMVGFVAAAGIIGAYFGKGLLVESRGFTAAEVPTAQVFLVVVALVGLALPPLHHRLNLVRRLPLALLLGGWALSGILYHFAQVSHQRNDEADFARVVANAQVGIEHRITIYAEALRGAASFVTTAPEFRRSDWVTYTETLNLEKRLPGLSGLGVVFPVPRNETRSFLERVRSDGPSDFSIHALPGVAPDDLDHFVVTHIAPLEANLSALGLDLASEPVRRRALEESRDTGEPRLASRLTLVQDSQHRPGFLLCAPVYQPGVPLATVAERRAALRMWVYAPFVTELFFQGALGARSGKLVIHVFEDGPLDAAHLLYTSGPAGRELPKFSVVRSVRMLGQSFTLGWTWGPAFISSAQSPLLWLAGSIALFTVVLGGWVVSLQTFREETETVVEQRTAELRASEERNRLLIEFSPVSLIVSREGKMVFANAAALKALGANSNAEVVTLPILQFIHPDSRASALSRLASLKTPGQVAPAIEHRLVRLDGTIIDALAQSVAIQFDGTLCHLTSVQDISDQKRTSNELARMTELLERTGALAKVGGWEVNVETKKLSWTRQTFVIAEIDTGIEPPLEEGINLFAPEVRPVIAAAVQAAIESGTSYDLTLPIITAKGRHRWVQTQGFAEQRAGKSVRLYGTFQDVTARVQSDLQARISELALKSISQGVLISGPDRRIISVNAGFTAITGFSEAEMRGRDCRMLQGPGTDPVIVEKMRSALRKAEAFSGELVNYRKDGSAYTNELTISPITDGQGQVTYFVGISRDVTERKKTEAALRESEARYQRAERGTTDGLWEWNIQTDQEYCSPRWLEILGYAANEAPANFAEFSKLIHPEDRARTLVESDASLREKRPYSCEMRLRRKSGEYVWVLSRAMVEFDAAGRPLLMAGAITDISRRMAAEAAQQESDRFAHAIADNIPGMVGYWDQELKNRFSNRGYLEWFGKTEEEMQGISIQELMGPELFEKNEPYIRAALRGEHQQFERKLIKPVGQVGYIWAQYIPHRIDGQPAGFFAMVTDITAIKAAQEELRLSDQRFRELINSVDAIVWEADAFTFQCTAVSSNAERILGYPTAAWLQPNFWAEHMHAEDRDQALRYSGACTGRLEDHKLEYRFLTQDGRTVWLREDVRVIAENGRPRWLRGLMIDITATRELEEQLRQSQKLQAVGTLAGGIAHDFNNILTGIYGYTALAQLAAGEQKVLQDYLAQIARAGRRAGELVRQILAFSRAGAADTARETLQFERIVNEAVKLLRPSSPSTIEFTVDVAAGLPVVQGSPSQLHQVVMNLGTNAIQAMGTKPGQLRVSLHACEVDEALASTMPGLRPGAFLCLAVRDSGHGMDAATQRRVFEPFFTTKGPGQGTGLGLSVVHGIVQSHHGAIRLTSEVESGTTFEVFIPASPAGSVVAAAPVNEIPRGRGERILVVDDEAFIAQSTRLSLVRLGYAVESETQVQAALARLERDPNAFDLVVSDQTMPVLTGLELARRIRALRSDLPVVIASGFSKALTPEAIQEAGVCEVVDKPYAIEKLADVVHRQLVSRRKDGRPSPSAG